MKKFTQKELVEKLLAFSDKVGSRNLSKSMIDKDPDMPGSATFKRYFGSWGKALSAAKLEAGIITGRPQDPPIFLGEDALDVIEGELLGDGSLDASPTANACFSHSTANWAYSDFLRQSLCTCKVPLRDEEFLSIRKGKPQKRVRSPSNITFGELRKLWYPQGFKIIPANIFLNKIRCLHWYLGDGYVETGTVKFSTCGFTKEEVEKLAQLLTDLGFKSTRHKRSGGYHIIRMSRLATPAFLEWIGPCPVSGYEHKWKIVPKRQRISKEQIIQAVENCMGINANISRSCFDRQGEFSSVTAIRLFGSWNAAKKIVLEAKQNKEDNR